MYSPGDYVTAYPFEYFEEGYLCEILEIYAKNHYKVRIVKDNWRILAGETRRWFLNSDMIKLYPPAQTRLWKLLHDQI